MKKSIQIIATALVMLFGNSALSQNDTIYFMKDGVIVHKQPVNSSDVDSAIFYYPFNLATLTTETVSSITETSAVSGGNITDNGGATVTSRGICWGTSPNPTLADNSSVNESGTGSFIGNLTGLTGGTTYYVRAYAINSGGTSYGNEVNFNSIMTDADGNVYTSVTIGTQEWTVENLRTTKYSDGTSISNHYDYDYDEWYSLTTGAWCNYNNSSSNDVTYGKLYNWYAVETGKLCPTGWHVPTDAEWTILTDYLTANGHSGAEVTALKATSGWNDYDGASRNGTDDYGWNGLPGGFRHGSGGFNAIGDDGYWWSSSQYGTDNAWCRHLASSPGSVYRGYSSKGGGFSVRCLRD